MVKEKKEPKEKNVNKLSKKKDGQLKLILLWMIGLIILFFLFFSFFQSLNKVEYEGVPFTKTKFGEIPVYHSSYFLQGSTAENVIKYNLYVRNNPEENDFPITDEISIESRTIYLTINETGLLECEQAAIAISDLTSFLVDNQFNLYVGVPDKELAAERDRLYVSCDTAAHGTVITIQEGNENSISRVENGCYDITVSQCQILEGIEKFKVQAVADAQRRKREA